MKKVLLVDDDEIFNFINTKLLQRSGLANDIQTAGNGREALKVLHHCYEGAKSLPDVIFLDLNMPVMDGFAFLEAFQKLDLPGREQVSVVIVTSSINSKDMERAKEMGVRRYLTKPVSEANLLDVFDEMVGGEV